MTMTADPEALLSHLPRADGSATYAYAGYTVTASVNGPIEAGRRDEDPYEALVDVIVRPSAGVGGTRERHLESILQSSLRQLVLVKDFPRCLIQIVLQIEATPENAYINTKLVQGNLNLPVIPALLQTAVLALLSAAVPLKATATASVVAVICHNGSADITADPSPGDLENAQSVHVLAFTSRDELLLAESEGDFSLDEWDRAYQTARTICCSPTNKTGMDIILDSGKRDGADMRHFVQSTIQARVAEDLHWKT